MFIDPEAQDLVGTIVASSDASEHLSNRQRICRGEICLHWILVVCPRNNMLTRGLEPPRVTPYGPEPYASANSATRARNGKGIVVSRAPVCKRDFEQTL